MREIYYSMDVTKFFVDKKKDGDIETTYIGEAEYRRRKDVPNQWYKTPADTAKPIRRIKKIVEDWNWNMEVFYPEWDDEKRFIRDERYQLEYL